MTCCCWWVIDVQGSVYRLLAEHSDALFGDEYSPILFKRSTLG